MSDARIEQLAETIASLGHEGIVRFDRTEPEWDFITTAHNQFDSEVHVGLLCILAATQDYQLAGDAQQFWQTLTETVSDRDSLDSYTDVTNTLGDFMDEPINARLREQKKDRLVRMLDNGFGEWFLDAYPDVDPMRIWEEIAAALETTREKKTVVSAWQLC